MICVCSMRLMFNMEKSGKSQGKIKEFGLQICVDTVINENDVRLWMLKLDDAISIYVEGEVK